MLNIRQIALVGAAVAGFGLAIGATAVEAKTCAKKAGQGTATTLEGAKFQVDEIMLQTTDWGAWAAWMASGNTPGYDFGPRTYKCKQGGWGYECTGTATICKH